MRPLLPRSPARWFRLRAAALPGARTLRALWVRGSVWARESFWAGARWWAALVGFRSRPTADALGRRGERAAVRSLRRAGYRILARRWKSRRGEEVDVVALHGATWVLVEVKATASAGAAPADRVDHRKRERLRAAAAALRRIDPGTPRPMRIDVVEVRFEGRRARVRIRPGHARLS